MVLVEITQASDRIDVFGPNGEVLVRVFIDPESGKYVVDDHATGRVFGDSD